MPFRVTGLLFLLLLLLPLEVAGAGDKVSHKGWPKINGVLRINSSRHGKDLTGTHRNDELLGGPGWNKIHGRGGDDVIWGDFRPHDQPPSQHDRLYGDDGRDFIYASHGWNSIHGGRGNDTIHGHFGRGFIRCDSGRDLVYLSHRSRRRYHLRGCERISYLTERQRKQRGG